MPGDAGLRALAEPDVEMLREICRMAMITHMAALEAKQEADRAYTRTFNAYQDAVEDYRRARCDRDGAAGAEGTGDGR